MTTSRTSKAKHKRNAQRRLRQALKRVDGITRMSIAIIHANWGDGPDKRAYREKY